MNKKYQKIAKTMVPMPDSKGSQEVDGAVGAFTICVWVFQVVLKKHKKKTYKNRRLKRAPKKSEYVQNQAFSAIHRLGKSAANSPLLLSLTAWGSSMLRRSALPGPDKCKQQAVAHLTGSRLFYTI